MKALSVLFLTTAVSMGACGDFSKSDGIALEQSSSSSSVRVTYPFQSQSCEEFKINPEATSQSWAAIREVAFRKLDKVAFDALYDAALEASRKWNKVTPISPIPADQSAIDEFKELIKRNYEEETIALKAFDDRIQALYKQFDLANPPLLCSRYYYRPIFSIFYRDSILEHEFLVREPSEEEQRAEYAKKDDYLRRVESFKSQAAVIEEERDRAKEAYSQRHRELYESKMSYISENFHTRQQDMLKTLVWDYIQAL